MWRAKIFSARVIGRFSLLMGGRNTFFCNARHVEGEQAAVLDHLPRDFVFAGGKFRERDFLSRPNLLDQREVGRSQQAQVLAVLFVNAFNILGDHQLDSGAHLRVGRLLAARAFAPPLAADGAHEAAFFYVAASDGQTRRRISGPGTGSRPGFHRNRNSSARA